MKAFSTVSTILLLCSGAAAAGQAGTLPANVSQHKISYKTYHQNYELVGPSKDVPKMFVFSAAGKCVGVTTSHATADDGAMAFITESLRKDKKVCDTAPADTTKSGEPEIDLVLFDGPFYMGCKTAKADLLQAAAGKLANMRLSILAFTP